MRASKELRCASARYYSLNMLRLAPAARQVAGEGAEVRDRGIPGPRLQHRQVSKTPVSRAWPCIAYILVGAAGD